MQAHADRRREVDPGEPVVGIRRAPGPSSSSSGFTSAFSSGPASGFATGGSSSGAASPVQAILGLQRAVGNAGVAQLIGGRDPRAAALLPVQAERPNAALLPVQAERPNATPAAPSTLPDASAAGSTPFRPTHARMVDNDLVAPVVYPFREQMLRRFVAWHRELELRQLGPDAQGAAVAQALARIRAERDRLAGLEAPNRGDQREKTRLDGLLARAERNAQQALSVAASWTHDHGADEVGGAALEAEVRRLGTALNLPAWEISTIVDYGGMRYGRSREETGGGGPTAHGSYFAPQRLLWAIESVRNGSVPADQATVLLNLSEADALGRLQAMRQAGRIPDRFWRLIVYRTDLRLDTTDRSWNDVNARAAEPATPEERRTNDEWRRVMTLWTADTAIRGVRGGASNVLGSTGWRAEMYRRRGVVALGVVCNELAESIANQRGINLPGGITQNARTFATDGSRGVGTGATGRYFGRVDDEHLVPGANLFFVKDNWQREGHAWDNVVAAPGVSYPQRLAPGATGTAPTELLTPGANADGWTYHVTEGEAVTRSRGPVASGGAGGGAGATGSSSAGSSAAGPSSGTGPTSGAAGTPASPGTTGTAGTPADAGLQGPEERQWMTWSHEATVAEIRGASVWTLETTSIGSGINERSKSGLISSPGTFLGVDATAHPAAAPATTPADAGGAGGSGAGAAGGPGPASGSGGAATATPTATGSATAGASGTPGATGAAGAEAAAPDAAAVSPADIQHAAETGRGGP